MQFSAILEDETVFSAVCKKMEIFGATNAVKLKKKFKFLWTSTKDFVLSTLISYY